MSAPLSPAALRPSVSYENGGTATFVFSEDETITESSKRLGVIQAFIRDPKVTSFYEDHCVYLPAMAGWFLFSALLSSYNKIIFGKDRLNFPCPLLLTSVHFATQWAFSLGMSKLFPVFVGSKRVDDMSWSEFLGISAPCGIVTAGDVGLSNLSLVTITITFYTMVKASTPIFVLIWAYFFGIMRITWSLCAVVFIIAVGEYLTVMGEVDFVLKGFLLCLMASILSGARWTLVQLKIQKLDPPLKSTVATMRVLAPFMSLTMFVVALAVEEPWASLRTVIDSWPTFFYVLGLGLGGAALAICMIMCEFYLIMHSNAVVLMIGGVIKEILTIFIGVNFFGDSLNLFNVIGCCVVFMGVILYKVVHHLAKMEEEAKIAVASEKDQSGDELEGPSQKRERQPLRILMKDDSDANVPEINGYKDEEQSETWKGLNEGIEMRRKSPRHSNSWDSIGDDPSMLVI